MRSSKSHKSALTYVLLALIPYSRENAKLVFAPNKFFYDLAQISKKKENTLRSAYQRAEIRGFIEQDKISKSPKLTMHGYRELVPFVSKKLDKKGSLMVIFDIPENLSSSRRRLRVLLKTWGFEQIQRSVWVTSFDYVRSLKEVIEELELTPYVELYECARLYPVKR